ncbi:hypothetical protein QUB29_19465 [Microcoleus sp. B4b_D2]|uniref:hypothetical protein n=1 Tax=Microcoleus sp. B4b_D2 TaxID=3055310 RepID=UPI002FD7209B
MLDPVVVAEAGKVSLTYPTIADFNLQMNFNPIIERFRLRGKFCLLHWQAKPFGERRWGVYDAGADSYSSIKYCELQLNVIPQLLQVDENVIKTVPTAVLFFPGSRLVVRDYYSLVPVL